MRERDGQGIEEERRLQGQEEMKDDGVKWHESTVCCEPKGMAMGNPFRCPVCNTLMEEDKDAGFKIPSQCPYLKTLYPDRFLRGGLQCTESRRK